jgi:hypothetical protein
LPPMDSNTHSNRQPAGQPTSQPAGPSVTPSVRPSAGVGDGPTARPSSGLADGLAALTAAVDQLAAQDQDGLPDATLAEQVLELRRLLDRLEGHWLAELAAVDALGAAGADQGIPAASTAGWLRTRLRMGAGAATSMVRTARALFRGPLTRTGQALTTARCRSPTPRSGRRHPGPGCPHRQ